MNKTQTTRVAGGLLTFVGAALSVKEVLAVPNKGAIILAFGMLWVGLELWRRAETSDEK